jgi:hypothetical protein
MNHRIFPITGLIAAGLWAAWGAGSASTRTAAGPEGKISVANGQVALGEYGIHPPFAYGKIDQEGAIWSSSANVTGSSRVDTGIYQISVAGGLEGTDIVLVTAAWQFPMWGGARVLANGKVEVIMFDVGPDPANAQFSFVIFRP